LARVAPTANIAAPVASPAVAWVLWLSIPIVVTVLAALGSWLRSRPPRPPDTRRAMREHDEFLDALVQGARSKDRARQPPRTD
jgi:hypothetical protein